MKIFGFSDIGRGAMVGGFCGYMLTTLVCGLITGDNMSGVVGIVIGLPAGLVIGAIIAAIRSKPTDPPTNT